MSPALELNTGNSALAETTSEAYCGSFEDRISVDSAIDNLKYIFLNVTFVFLLWSLYT